MTKRIETAKLSFNPEDSEDPELVEIFKSHAATVLWCCIKSNHITDQFFNGKILDVCKELDKKKEEYIYFTYHDFIKICAPLNTFGIINVREFSGYTQRTDHEYWGGIYEAVERYGSFKIEISKPG